MTTVRKQHHNSKAVLLFQWVMVSLCQLRLLRSSTSCTLANVFCEAWPAGMTPPASTVPSIFAEPPRLQTPNQGQPVKATAASRKRTADQALDSPATATKSRKKATKPAVKQASNNGPRVLNGLTMPTPAVSQPPKDGGLRTVGGLTMPSLPEAPSASQALGNGLRSVGGLTMPGLSEAQVSSQAPNNGLRTVGGFTVPSLPEPSFAQPVKRAEATHRVPNNGQLRTANSIAAPYLPTPSQHPNTFGGTRNQARDLRATVDVSPSPLEDPPGSSIDHHAYQYFPKDQHIELFSNIELLCAGCRTPKEGSIPFWLCGDCTPDGISKKSRDTEYQILKERSAKFDILSNDYQTLKNAYMEYQSRAKAINTNEQQKNKLLNGRIQELEDQNIKSMSRVSKAQAVEKENKELHQRVQSQQRIVALYNQRYGADAGVNFTTTGEEPALTQTANVGLMPLPGQVPSRGQSPGNQVVRQLSPNGVAMNRALSPGQNPNAVAMNRAVSPHPSQVVSPRPSHAGTAMGHGRASSQGTIHFPSNQAASPQPNPNAFGMNIGRAPSQASNGVSMNQRLSPGRAPNGFAINHSQNGNVFDGVTVGQGQGPNGFAMNQNQGFSQDGNGFAMNDGAVVGQGQDLDIFDANQGGSSSQGSACDSFHLQGGNVGGFRYPSPHP